MANKDNGNKLGKKYRGEKIGKGVILLSVVLFVFLLLVWILGFRFVGGPVTYLVQEGLLTSLLYSLQCVSCLFFVFWVWFHYRPKLEGEGRIEGRKAVWFAFCVAIGLCSLVLVYHHSSRGNQMVSGEVPYISQGVLPLMGQMEEENPDFSVQQPVKNGFVNISRNFFAPTYLILRQDGRGGEWYHILYTELCGENLAKTYAEEISQKAEQEGWDLQAVDGGVYWIAEYPQEGNEEVLLFCRGNVVVKVTYHGSKELFSCATAWEMALFPEE